MAVGGEDRASHRSSLSGNFHSRAGAGGAEISRAGAGRAGEGSEGSCQAGSNVCWVMESGGLRSHLKHNLQQGSGVWKLEVWVPNPHQRVHTPLSGAGGSAAFGVATGGPDPIGWGHSAHPQHCGEQRGAQRLGGLLCRGSRRHREGCRVMEAVGRGGQLGPTRAELLGWWRPCPVGSSRSEARRAHVGLAMGWGLCGVWGGSCMGFGANPTACFSKGPDCCELSAVAEARRFLSRCARRLLGEGLRGLYYYLLSLRGEKGKKKRKKPPLLGTVPNQSRD